MFLNNGPSKTYTTTELHTHTHITLIRHITHTHTHSVADTSRAAMPVIQPAQLVLDIYIYIYSIVHKCGWICGWFVVVVVVASARVLFASFNRAPIERETAALAAVHSRGVDGPFAPPTNPYKKKPALAQNTKLRYLRAKTYIYIYIYIHTLTRPNGARTRVKEIYARAI